MFGDFMDTLFKVVDDMQNKQDLEDAQRAAQNAFNDMGAKMNRQEKPKTASKYGYGKWFSTEWEDCLFCETFIEPIMPEFEFKFLSSTEVPVNTIQSREYRNIWVPESEVCGDAYKYIRKK